MLDDAKVNFTCPECEREISEDKEKVGFKVPCPFCQNDISIPPFGIVRNMKIGDFVVHHRLGTGAMGEVWLADQTSMGREVALKILCPVLCANEELVNRFVREIKMAGRLSHPNIISAYHAGREGKIYYLATEYINGLVLEDRLLIEEKLTEAEGLKITRQMAEALKYAWDNFQFLHRDIKPGNIMIRLDGTAMLMDMGLSKSLKDDTSLTLTGTMMGTPHYLSPEQAKAEKDIDFRSDMYSLGATLFHLLTGKFPFRAKGKMEIASMHITDPVPDCRKLNPAISPECKAFIDKCMAKNKERRFRNWDEFLEQLDQIQGRDTQTSTHQPQDDSRRKRLFIALGIAAAVVVIILLIHFLFGAEGDGREGNRLDPDNPFVIIKSSDDGLEKSAQEPTGTDEQTPPGTIVSSDAALLKEIKEQVGVGDTKAEQLCKIVKDVLGKLKDHPDPESLGREALDRSRAILNEDEDRRFGEYVGSLFKKNGVELPPPQPPPPPQHRRPRR